MPSIKLCMLLALGALLSAGVLPASAVPLKSKTADGMASAVVAAEPQRRDVQTDQATTATPDSAADPSNTTNTSTVDLQLMDNTVFALCSAPSYITVGNTLIASNVGSTYYGLDQFCAWTIRAPEGYVAVLTFLTFSTEYGYDFVSVYDGPTTNLQQRILHQSGFALPSQVVGSGTYLTVTFSSDSSFVYTGFILRVNFQPLFVPIQPLPFTCSGTVTLSQSGAVLATNPGYSTYGNNQYCVWTIVAPLLYVPTLSFTSFNTELDFDFISVYDGPSTLSPRLLHWSGNQLPGTVYGSQRVLTVVFTSDSSFVYSGVTALVGFHFNGFVLF